MRYLVSLLGLIGILGQELPAATVPEYLPRYDLRIQLDTDRHHADILQRTTWTNHTSRPTQRIVLNFYPLYQIPSGERFLLAKTLEMLRLNPEDGIDDRGRHGSVRGINLIDPEGKSSPLEYRFRKENPTSIEIDWPEEIPPGGNATFEIDCTIKLPNKQGRWGHWKGITYLTHALPTVAYYDSAGWHDMPFIAWHQPFWNEAGIYTGSISLPEKQIVVLPTAITSEEQLKDNWKRLSFGPFVGRDFAILASDQYRATTKTIKLPSEQEVLIRVISLPQHRAMAEQMLPIAEQALTTYSRWFGGYPYPQFTVVESYFGWNGNECSGLVMIDERVFDMPVIGIGYIEYLLSHEICHQWWYNLIGTNGYSETFMDEGPATYFTHRMLDDLRGRNNRFLEWPDNVRFAPNIRRENYRHGPVTSAIRRHELPPAAGQLADFGNLFALFSGAYDRGSKVFGMIEERVGEEAFFDLMRGFMRKYSFQVISATTLKNELEAQTGREWDGLFDRWIYGKGTTDWGIVSVTVDGKRPRGVLGVRARRLTQIGPGPYQVEVTLRQRGDYDEPTFLGFQFAPDEGFPIRIPVGPTTRNSEIAEFKARIVPLGERRLRVTITLEREPINIVVDPDSILLDANRDDNAWNRAPRWNITPIYNATSESDLTNDYDRWNINAGLWIWGPAYLDPWYTRSAMVGARLAAYRTQTFQGGVYTALRTSYRDLVFGTDGLFDHWPFPKTQVGYSYERRIAGPFFGTNGEQTANRGVLFGRYVFTPSSSMYQAPMHYIEGFTAYQDNFLPFARVANPGDVRPGFTWLSGVHHRLNLLTPYWDPTRGVWLDWSYAAGIAQVDERTVAQQFRGELAAARKLPDGLGWASEIRLAGRVQLGGAFPTRGQFFTLGGAQQFRGFDLAERQGSWFWTASAEARLPLIRDSRFTLLDNIIGLRHLYLTPFYDAGAIYSSQKLVSNTAHALGIGFRADLSIFSFIERATMRFDVAKTINEASPFQFWFGIQHPF